LGNFDREVFRDGVGTTRSHARVEKLFSKLSYAEETDHGVLVLEGRELPTAEVTEWIATKARLKPAQLTIVIAPTASLAGGSQISARVLETGLRTRSKPWASTCSGS
jgi:methenyltetrahydromethanopterin cyclohydrolase